MSQELTDRWGPKVIGWTVDVQECPRHDGHGIGINILVLMPDGMVVPLWYCSLDRIDDFFVDK